MNVKLPNQQKVKNYKSVGHVQWPSYILLDKDC